MKSKFILALAAVSLAVKISAAEAPLTVPTETPKQHDARMEWFREARFGMFIHWGLYSVAAGEINGKRVGGAGEWIMQSGKIPISQYQTLVPQFNPVKFDAKEWVGIAKNAGMKYIVITSKHHDGFGLWPSEQTDWCIKSTPFHRDPLQELSDECRKQGIKFCLYHSIMDWHHPDWGTRRAWNDVIDTNVPPDMDRFDAYLKAQLKEIVTRYHPGLLWFDGEWESPWTYERGVDLWNYLRALDPQLIVNNRIGKGRVNSDGKDLIEGRIGDYGTPEQRIPPQGFGPGVDWETCMTMNNTWGYRKDDDHWKSTETLIRNLCDIASKGGNYLLNVGPTGEGLIPEASVERLAEMGKWMKVNGEAIYDCGSTPFGAEAGTFSPTEKDKNGNPKFVPSWNWRATTRPGKIYLEIFNWPADGKFELPGLQSKVSKVTLLATGKKLKFEQTAAGVSIVLSAEAPDKIASVVCVEIKDKTAKVAAQK
jgi:alpha-L-fucosidase